KIGVGARATAMGETFVAVANDASALFWNPAGITQFAEDQVIVSHTDWLVDIRHQFLGGVYHLSSQDAIGMSVTVLHMDDMPVTTEVQPFGTGEYFRFGDLAVGLSYSRKLTNQFSFGTTVRYIEETMDVLKMRGVTVDIGTYYWTGLGTSRFSAVVSNFGNQINPSGTATLYGGQKVSSFEEYTPPTIFKFGFAFEPINDEENVLTTALQLNHPNDNSENLSLGLEYTWMKIFSLRGGYKFNVDEQTASFGAGVAVPIDFVHLNVDYGFSAFNRLGNVQRISLLLKL
ncbi:MAG: PorV/PorQ family protein, partial [Bacteroidota bacterium]|nr:PorV/PorQ family protein [Bacteroidota bacterium]